MTDERKALYWLSASGMPANKQNKLLEIFGTAIDIMEALPSEKIREFVGRTRLFRVDADQGTSASSSKNCMPSPNRG